MQTGGSELDLAEGVAAAVVGNRRRGIDSERVAGRKRRPVEEARDPVETQQQEGIAEGTDG